jgi:hypothetical protein
MTGLNPVAEQNTGNQKATQYKKQVHANQAIGDKIDPMIMPDPMGNNNQHNRDGPNTV